MQAFLDNARVQVLNEGLYFYEKDVIMSKYLFSRDLRIDIRLGYQHSGFGVIIAEDEEKVEAGVVKLAKQMAMFTSKDISRSTLLRLRTEERKQYTYQRDCSGYRRRVLSTFIPEESQGKDVSRNDGW